ncbi:GRASP65 1 [Candida viswanathii]|uniref:GRASP65 1 n=1 Tax=Candida viswanathii TaxID=5486 RepID=A0A367XUQ4_9ASCO|nr:GRASP65 1 [Candida viswanathii]
MFSFAKKLVDRLEGNSPSDSGIRDSYFKNATEINNNGYALRVLNVVPHSTAHEKGFESWFDYIIRINNHELPMLYPQLSNYSYSINDDGTINYGGNATSQQAAAINFDLLMQEINTLAKHEQDLVVDVWSAKGGIIRQISLPLGKFEEKAEGDGQDEDQSVQKLFVNNFKQLGLTLESQHLNTATYVWRILATHQGSPAFMSQLVPYSDYIIGCDSAFPTDVNGKGLLAIGGESLLSKTVLNYYNYHYATASEDNVPITLYVYNHDYDILRPVTVNLSRSWGTGQNKGILGCDVGYGLLHRIPEVVGKFESNSIVDDVLFESNQNVGFQPQQTIPPQHSAYVPASPEKPQENYINTAPPPAVGTVPPPPRGAARKKKHVVDKSAVDSLDDYMNEELEKSKKLDVSTKPSGGSADAPPPPPPPAAK